MNAQARVEQSESESPAIAGMEHDQSDNDEKIRSQSIRVLFDTVSTNRCDYCGQMISEYVKYRGVTVRESNGEISEYSFCEEQCMSAEFPHM